MLVSTTLLWAKRSNDFFSILITIKAEQEPFIICIIIWSKEESLLNLSTSVNEIIVSYNVTNLTPPRALLYLFVYLTVYSLRHEAVK